MPMADLLGGFGAGASFGQQIGDGLAASKRQGKLAQLLQQGMDPAQRQATLGQIARVGGQEALTGAQASFGKMDEAARDDLATTAGHFAAIAEADPEAAAQMYPQLAAKAHAIGIPVPQTYDPKFLPAIQKIAGTVGGSIGVQSTYVDAQGNRVAIMRDGSVRTLGMNAPNNQIIDTGNGFFGVNKGNLQAAPVMVGGAPQQQPTQFVGADGQPVQIDPSLPAEVQASIRANEGAYAAVPNGAMAQIGPPAQQLRSAPKPSDIPDTYAPLTSDEVARLGLPPGTVAQRNIKTGEIKFGPQGVQPQSNGPTPAQAFKIQQTARKERQMLAANDAGIDQTVKLIDGILARKGEFGGVTGMGRFGAKIPGTDWADIAAKLDTLKGRSAFGALQQMRANSPTGGALGSVSERELYLLQNAEAQLQDSQSPESLAKALVEYKAALLDSKRRLHEGLDEFYAGQTPQGAPTQAAAPSAGPKVLKFNPATGRIE